MLFFALSQWTHLIYGGKYIFPRKITSNHKVDFPALSCGITLSTCSACRMKKLWALFRNSSDGIMVILDNDKRKQGSGNGFHSFAHTWRRRTLVSCCSPSNRMLADADWQSKKWWYTLWQESHLKQEMLGKWVRDSEILNLLNASTILNMIVGCCCLLNNISVSFFHLFPFFFQTKCIKLH